MPWVVKKNSVCPASHPWAVMNQQTNRVVACHMTENSARKQMKALYANVPESRQS